MLTNRSRKGEITKWFKTRGQKKIQDCSEEQFSEENVKENQEWIYGKEFSSIRRIKKAVMKNHAATRQRKRERKDKGS